jgi:hypothetical protein
MLIKNSKLLRHGNGRCEGEIQMDLLIADGSGIRVD